ncbi:Cytosolic 5'-nucleotidase 3A [Schistosoma japonicum]|nr:Cytosolic 5'-nucleotidase 3A [Schistosoma japonicum]
MFCSEPQVQINSVNNYTTTIQNTLEMTVSTLLNQILENSDRRNINSSTVFIKNKKIVEKKLEILATCGNDKLEIVTDFDRTLSKHRHKNGELAPTCYSIFESDPELTETTKSMLVSQRAKYYPIEVDRNLTESEKVPYMLEWWGLAHDAIVECGIHRSTLEKTVKECHLELRIINNGLPKRPNILLLGDSTGDVHMADGATVDDPTGQLGTVLRIGFLNDSVEENLEIYQSLYDIVLVNDATFNIPLKIIQSILKHEE